MQKARAILFLATITVFLYSIVYQVNNYYKNKFIQKELDLSLKELQINYNIIQYHYENVASAFIDSFSKNQEFLHTLSLYENNPSEHQQLRDQLYAMLIERYNGSLKLGVSSLLFTDTNNNVILRMHEPNKHSDDLTNVRFGISYVNHLQKPIKGFETGKYGDSFRFIYPLFDQNKNFLGSVDIGFSPAFMQHTFDQVHQIHTHFILHKSIFPKADQTNFGNVNFYQPSVEHKDYMLSIRKNVEHTQKLIVKDTMQKYTKLIEEKIDSAQAFSLYGIKDDKVVVSAFLPIQSIEKTQKTLAYIVSHNPNEQILRILSHHRYIDYSSIFIILLLSVFVYKEVSNRRNLEMKIQQKTQELQEINENLEHKVALEVEKNIHNEIKLYEQSKLAALGDMIGNIVHQWRQPLSAIVAIASATRLQNELGVLQGGMINENMEKVVLKAQYLSETIDTFRNYLKEEKIKQRVVLQDRINIALTIVSTVLNDNNIKIINTIDYSNAIHTHLILGELSQVIINVMNNAKDALVDNKIEDPWVKIDLQTLENKAIITIEDNAGGIPQEVITHVFDQNYTTKDHSVGTGLGLYMSKKIMQESFDGDIYVQNTQNGAKFFIELLIID